MSVHAATGAPAPARAATAWLGALVLGALAAVMYARPAASLWSTWMTNDNYSHGPLVPVTSLALVWLRRDALRARPVRPDARGLWLVGGACLLLMVGTRADVFALQAWSILVLLFGFSLTFAGPARTRVLAFPILYLAFMLTFPPVIMNTLNFALKELAVNLSARMVEAAGMTLHRQGMMFFFPSGELRIESPCSGLRSLLALVATGTLFAYVQPGGLWRRAAVLLATVPIALTGNVVRLALVLVAASRRGVDWAAGPFHDLTGYVLYAVALALLLGLRALLTPRRERSARP